MKIKDADSIVSYILGSRRASPKQEIDATAAWISQLGYFSLFAGAASLFSAQPQEVWAKAANEKGVPPRISKKAKVLAQLNA